MHEAGALVAGASVARPGGLARRRPARVQRGRRPAPRDARPRERVLRLRRPGGAIAWLLREGAERIAYVDVDVHHGDGVQAIFWDDPRVLTISIHQYLPGWFFPGTGGSTSAAAPGARVGDQRAAAADVGDDAWLEAFRAVIRPRSSGSGPTCS